MRVFQISHYDDVIMTARASQIISLTTIFWIVYSGPDQRKQQSSASLAFVRGIHRWPVNSPHKGPVTRKMMKSSWITYKNVKAVKVLGSRHYLFHMWYRYITVYTSDRLGSNNHCVKHIKRMLKYMSRNYDTVVRSTGAVKIMETPYM